MYGIEFLILSIFTLFLPYIIFELDDVHKRYYLMASIYIATYYVLKSICISAKIRSEYMNSISDVKEIVKKEKTKRRNIEDLNETIANKEDNDKTENKKKRGRSRKESTIKTDTDSHKKRGRPKKNDQKNSKKIKNDIKEHNKRGRPRKAVTNND